MKTIIVTLVIFLISQIGLTNPKKINFEGAGYVTGMYPVKYSGTVPSIDIQIVYAKTDVGGLYKSTNNGNTWNYIFNIGSSVSSRYNKSDLQIQGFAVCPTNEDILLVAAGDGSKLTSSYNGGYYIFRSTNGGSSWSKISITQEIDFKGDNFYYKTGGECILFDPGDPSIVYLAGLTYSTSGGTPKILKSTNYGVNWSSYATVGNISSTEEFICLAKHPDRPNELWAGGKNGVYRTIDNGANWTWHNSFNYVRRIILKSNGSSNPCTAFITYGTETEVTNGYGLARFDGSWTELTGYFDATTCNFSYSCGAGTLTKSFFGALMFTNSDENQIVAGRWRRPLRITNSTNLGTSWCGNDYGFTTQCFFKGQIFLKYDGSNVVPDHQFSTEEGAFSGLTHFVKNPNANRGDYWYSSGGAAPYKSTTGGIGGSSTWTYTGNGINIPIVNDISINIRHFNNVYIPIADWTMGQSTYNSIMNNDSKLFYDRQETNEGSGDTKISIVSRILHSKEENQANISYCIGGSVYDPHKPYMYKRIANSQGQPTQVTKIGLQFNNDNDRAFVDGILYSTDALNDAMVILKGLYSAKEKQTNYSDLGVYVSTNDGANWTAGNFVNLSDENNETITNFENALIPGMGDDGYFASPFDNQFNISKATGTDLLMLYLEGYAPSSSEDEGGGFFVSTNNGTDWKFQSTVIGTETGDKGYKGEGCLKYGQFSNGGKVFLAIKQTVNQRTLSEPRGIYYAPYDGYETGDMTTWSRITNFVSASYLDAFQDAAGRKIITAFARTSSDANEKIYVSYDEGQNFSELSNSENVTAVSSLRIFQNGTLPPQLWIGTSGMGVFIYDLTPAEGPSKGVYEITDNIVIDTDMKFEYDVRVKSGASITFKNNIEIILNSDINIVVENDGSISTDELANVTFTAIGLNASWGGIEIQGNATVDLQNCTFNNTATPIRILELETVPLFVNPINIDSCTFNEGYVSIENRTNVHLTNNEWNYTSSSGQEVCGVLATGSGNLLIKDNTINYSSNMDPTTGIALIYCDDNTTVYGNIITNTSTGISVSNSSPFISRNIIINADPSTIYGTGIALDNSYAAVVNKNEIYDCFNGIQLYYSSPTLFKNKTIYGDEEGESNGLFAEYISNARLNPTIDGETTWDAGNNYFYNNASDASGIRVDESMPSLECGYNFIYGRSYHISGSTKESGDWDAINNNWLDNPPDPGKFDLDVTVLYDQYITLDPVFDDEDYQQYYQLQDTIYYSYINACDPEENFNLFTAATLLEHQGNYSSAKTMYETLISNEAGSITSILSMKRILHCMDKMNSNSESYGSLRTYYSTLNTNHQSDTSFSQVAAELATKCLVRQKQFSSAISEYEDVVTSSGSPGQVLNAQLNIIETYLIAQIGGDNMGGDFTGRIAALKPTDVKDALKKMNSLLGRNKKQENIITSVPETFELSQNYPNPFNPVTKINFALPVDGKVSLVIYDMLGREMAKLVNSELRQAGRHTVEFNGSNLASGIYFYRLIVEGEKKFVQAKKMVMIK